MPTLPPAAARNFDEPIHGRMELPSLNIAGYSLALHDLQDPDEGFIGDRASRGGFRRRGGLGERGHERSPEQQKCDG